jgi:hypothetical protein
MKLPWRDKTGIPKAIAILATTAILAFGLCTANVVMGVPDSDSRWLKPLQYLIPLCSIFVVASVISLAVLFDLNKRRSRRRP